MLDTQTQEMEKFFTELEGKLLHTSQDEILNGALKIEKFLKGEMEWRDLFCFTPEQIAQIAEMGYQQFKMGRYADAEKYFKVLTLLFDDNFYYHSMLGSIYQRQKRDGEAIAAYTIAIELFEGDIVSLTNRGEIFMKHGWFKDATHDFEKAIALDATGENRWAERSRILLKQIQKG